jgi:hypothetical protein
VSAHVEELAALAASLPPGAVLAHVVTYDPLCFMAPMSWHRVQRRRVWAKIGDEPWRSVSSVEFVNDAPVHAWADGVPWPKEGSQGNPWVVRPSRRALLTIGWPWTGRGVAPGQEYRHDFHIVTRSVTWEQPKGGLTGRHEVMGVVG